MISTGRVWRRLRRGALIVPLAMLGGLPGGVPAARGHDEHDWIRRGGYRSPLTNEWCCDKHDCVPIPASQVEPTAPGWLLTPSGEVVPYIDTLPSEDGRFWRCHQPNGVRRCFFAPPGLS